jgi:hypothetical protein
MMNHLILFASQIDLSPLPKAGSGFIPKVLSVAIGIIAAVCLLFIVIGGSRYILSQGDPQGIAKAKGTIVYALIGLVVVILAQVIVTFIIGGVS